MSSIKIRNLHFGTDASGLALINTACPWASDEEDLTRLYSCSNTSGMTTRTSVLSSDGDLSAHFDEDLSLHSVKFINESNPERESISKGTINSYGYSPHPLSSYLSWIEQLFSTQDKKKPVIISITGPPEAIEIGIERIRSWYLSLNLISEKDEVFVGVEVNLSCPNIKGVSIPSGYDPEMISQYMICAYRGSSKIIESELGSAKALPIGLKLPPYTYKAQFTSLVAVLSEHRFEDEDHPHPISFLTSTNTLGSATWFAPSSNFNSSPSTLESLLPTSSSTGFDGLGGLAGESLHPISLGNVFQLRNLLDSDQSSLLKGIVIIGVGGVVDAASCLRMKRAGAGVIGLATGLGRDGVEIFGTIREELEQLVYT